METEKSSVQVNEQLRRCSIATSRRQSMKTVGYIDSLPINDPKSLQDIELNQPLATGRDLLVKLRAIAVNPVDYKIRKRMSGAEGAYKVLGCGTLSVRLSQWEKRLLSLKRVTLSTMRAT
jgi:hypothetical protein